MLDPFDLLEIEYAGYRAYHQEPKYEDGLEMQADNPYQKGNECYEAWQRGYDLADHDAAR